MAQTEAYQAKAAADTSSPFGEFAAELDTTSAELRKLGLTRYSVSLAKSLDTLAPSGTAWVITDGNYAQIDELWSKVGDDMIRRRRGFRFRRPECRR